MKRLLALILAIFLLISCAACGSDDGYVIEEDDEEETSHRTKPSTESPTEAATEPTPEPQQPTTDTTHIRELIAAGEYHKAYEQLSAIEDPTEEETALLNGFHYEILTQSQPGYFATNDYDSWGNLIHQTISNNTVDEEYYYAYDTNGNLLSVDCQKETGYASHTSYTYDKNGNTIRYQFSDNQGTAIINDYTYIYDQNGQLTKKICTDATTGHTQSYEYIYFDNGRPRTIKAYEGNTHIANYDYTYNKNGDIESDAYVSQIDQARSGITNTFDEDGILVETYKYELTANYKLTQTTTTYAYYPDGNLHQETQVITVSPDDTVTTVTTTYTWQLFYNPNLASEKEAA